MPSLWTGLLLIAGFWVLNAAAAEALYDSSFLTESSPLQILSPADPPSCNRFSTVQQIIEAGITDSLFPGAVLLIGTAEQVLCHTAFGHAALYDSSRQRLPDPEPMTRHHLFDIASLTKIFATTYALMHLHSHAGLDIDEPVSTWLPPFNATGKRTITPRHLLSHTSGLMPWYPTYYVAENPRQRLEFIAGLPLAGEVGRQRQYSDLGFMVLGDLVEKVSGMPLDKYLQKNIYQPLKAESTLFNPDRKRFPYIASTSHGNPFEKRMVYEEEFGYRVNVNPGSWNGWRHHVLRGEVNDGNAFHTHQGKAGHAGLFSTAADLHRLLAAIATNGSGEETSIFTSETIDLFLTQDRFDNGLGWAMDPDILNAGEIPGGSFGHTGFTGVHFIVVPQKDLIVILLTNRQHFGVGENHNYPDLTELRKSLLEEVTHAMR